MNNKRTCTIAETARMFFMGRILQGSATPEELQQFVADCDRIMRFRVNPAQHAEVLYYQTCVMKMLLVDEDEVRYQAEIAAAMAKANHVLYAYVASTLLALTCTRISPAERYERMHEGVSREMVVLDRDTWRCSDKEFQAADDLISAAYKNSLFMS